jgi:thiamine-phosphate pyrophosphorylase
MARCYSGCVPFRHPPLAGAMPDVWLVSDERIDDALPRALARLPRGSGFIFRHYGLPPGERRGRFRKLARAARRRGHRLALSGTPREARRWGADAVYGPPERLARGPAIPRLVTAHSLHEVARANRARAAIVLISPVFATRSHPGAPALGPVRFRLLAARSRVPVIAMGGLNPRRARSMGVQKWAAIQSLAERPTSMFPIHS